MYYMSFWLSRQAEPFDLMPLRDHLQLPSATHPTFRIAFPP